jgi:hypothetical protein
MIFELFWQWGIFVHDFGTALTLLYFLYVFLHDFGTVLTVWYFSTWFRNCSDSVVFFYMFFYMISELFWQCSISYMISELFWECSISYMISEMFCQCSISYMISELFWQCVIFLHDFGTALTVLYFSTCFSKWFLNCSVSVVFPTWFLNYSNSVVFFYMTSELLWQCCIALQDFWTVLTV